VIPEFKKAMRLAGKRPVPCWPVRAPVKLHGKRILLTGASSGIGAVAARRFAAEGATVIAVARRAAVLAEVVDQITAEGGSAVAMAADLDQVDAVVKSVGTVDVLINNAARSNRRPLRLMRGLAPGMLARGDGHVVNVATWRVLPESSPMFAVYNASKAALTAVSRVVDTEWDHAGVHSTTVYYALVAPR
jgi:NAD(P)-dependent dehydrogenase (short-subunit alcohol dehydrogenase family)